MAWRADQRWRCGCGQLNSAASWYCACGATYKAPTRARSAQRNRDKHKPPWQEAQAIDRETQQ
eukprot:7236568-Pyramimonas_sp.AAC.1